MELKINKKIIVYIVSIILLLSALVYNLLYINNKKNEIINEIENQDIEEDIKEIEEEKNTIFVDIGGEVINPGLYELPENSRVNDAIIIAGGVTDKADLSEVNLAFILSDAMKITIPKKEVKKTVASKTTQTKVNIVSTAISVSEPTNIESGGKININTATKEQLKTLTGIGEATADKIIDYRNENGSFNKIEDIKEVSGIGDSKYDKIKDKICI